MAPQQPAAVEVLELRLHVALNGKGLSMTQSAQDPLVILAGIRQFGLAPDGSDLRDLEAAIRRLTVQAQPRAAKSPRTLGDQMMGCGD